MLSSGLGGLFLMGIFFPRIGGKAALTGFVCGVGAVFAVRYLTTRVSALRLHRHGHIGGCWSAVLLLCQGAQITRRIVLENTTLTPGNAHFFKNVQFIVSFSPKFVSIRNKHYFCTRKLKYKEHNSLNSNKETMSDIEAKVKAIIVDKLSVDESEVKNEASFANDLGADSLDTVELIMEFEKEFGITIPDDKSEKISTVGDAIAYIEGEVNK